ncbi:MAG: ChaN family lipoprotein [Desulfobacterales bacterium]|nr:ChaN family lipoprotein [Desulfobacterales bacterium]
MWTIFCVFLMGCAGHKLNWQSPYRELSSLKEGDIIHIPTGVKITKEQLINMLTGTRIIYVGEVHDNINSHKVQMEILKALTKRHPKKIAVGIEMLKRSSQESADQWTSGKIDEKDFVKIWLKNWSNDFQYYRSILHYIRENKIPLIALRAPGDWLERVKKAESADQPKDNEEEFPQMDFQDPYHRAHIKAVFGKHPMGGQSFESFYRVQVLWDESMAESIAEYLQGEHGQDKQMLIFAGSHHIQYGFGIPRRVFRRIPLPYAIVLPMTVHVPPEKKHKLMAVTPPEIPLQSGDFAWIVSYQDLDDQRVYLGVMIRDTDDGVKVLGTLKNSTAEEVGLQKNDIITAMDGEPIETRFDLTYLIGLKKPGERGIIEVLRDKKPLSFEVTFKARDGVKP